MAVVSVDDGLANWPSEAIDPGKERSESTENDNDAKEIIEKEMKIH